MGRHHRNTRLSTKSKGYIVLATAGAFAGIILPRMALASDPVNANLYASVRDQCAEALTWTDRTDEQRAFLRLCVDSLTSPKPTTSPTPTPDPTLTPTPSVSVTTTQPSFTTPPVTTLPPTTAVPSPTSASQPTATPTPTQTPPTGNTKPTDVGIPPFVVPTPGGPCTINTSNVTFDSKVFDCASNGVVINGQNVTIKRSVIKPGPWWSILINGSASIEDTSVGNCSTDSSISGGNFTIRRVNLTTAGDGFWLSGPNANVSNSFVKLCGSGGTHADGIQLSGTGGNNAVFDNVTFDMSYTELGAQNSPVFWSGSSQGNNATIKNSLLIAGGYSLRVHSGIGLSLINNVIKRNSWQFGPTLIDSGRVSVCTGNSVANVDSNYVATNKTSIGC